MTSRRGPNLPYSLVAGVTSWSRYWLVASAKMHAATFAPEEPRLYDSFLDVLGERPSFSVIVVNAPIGFADVAGGDGRTCDREARALLGRRGAAIQRAPSRADLQEIQGSSAHLDAVSALLLPRYREIAREISPYRQRVVYGGHPELSFFELNAKCSLLWSKKTEAGRMERRKLLNQRVPGVERVLGATSLRVPEKHLLDAAALLWSARRVLTHSAARVPSDAEWDSEGLRTEFVM